MENCVLFGIVQKIAMENSIPGAGLTTNTKRRDKSIAMAGMFDSSNPLPPLISHNTDGNSILRREE
jgi:hypothetical protein